MSARLTAPMDPLVALAVRQARHRIANPAEVAHLPAHERTRLFAMAWAVLKTAQGCPTVQRLRYDSGHISGGDAA